MRRPSLPLLFPAATLFLAVALGTMGVLCAQENMTGATKSAAQPATPAAKSAKRAADLLKRFDKNGDGKLDDDERAEAKEVMMSEQLDLQAARAASVPGGPEAYRARMLELFDRNKDGRLDDDERAAAQRFGVERGFNPNGELRDDLIKRFDINANGRIDEDERAALQKFVKQRMAQGIDGTAGENAALVAVLRASIEANAVQRQRFDTDKDGKLNDTEWAFARKRILSALDEGGELKPSPADEQRRLNAVAAEVARRRKAREDAINASQPKK